MLPHPVASKAKAIARVVGQAAAQPRLALLALQERGLAFIISQLFRSSPEKLDSMMHGLSVRSSTDTLENLRDLFNDQLSDVRVEDEDHYRICLKSGPMFIIRKEVCVADMRVVEETFIRRLYREHPPLSGRTVLDIGANLGDTCVYYALQGARVFAYEPSAELFDIAVRNAALNGVDIELNNVGVGCEDCTLELAIGPRGASSMSMTMFPGVGAPNDPQLVSRIGVRVVPLSGILARVGHVFFMKVDCEGCEYPALLSLSTDELRTIDHIFLEYHASPEPLRKKLEDSGFAVRFREWKLMLADRLA